MLPFPRGHQRRCTGFTMATGALLACTAVLILRGVTPHSGRVSAAAIRQAPSVSVTITVIPALTCRKMESDLGAAKALGRVFWITGLAGLEPTTYGLGSHQEAPRVRGKSLSVTGFC